METKKYFAVSEVDNNNLNMGVICACSFEEFMEKIKLVCSNHFDSNIIGLGFTAEDYTNIVESGYFIERECYIGVDGDDDREQLIGVTLTTLY